MGRFLHKKQRKKKKESALKSQSLYPVGERKQNNTTATNSYQGHNVRFNDLSETRWRFSLILRLISQSEEDGAGGDGDWMTAVTNTLRGRGCDPDPRHITGQSEDGNAICTRLSRKQKD